MSATIEKLINLLRKSHHVYLLKRKTQYGLNYFVVIESRDIKNGRLQYVHIEVENESKAQIFIQKFKELVDTTKDKCVICPAQYQEIINTKEKPKKIEAGFYEYRGYEIADTYDTTLLGGPSGGKKDRWVAKEKQWDKGEYFMSFDRLIDAFLTIDYHLDKK